MKKRKKLNRVLLLAYIIANLPAGTYMVTGMPTARNWKIALKNVPDNPVLEKIYQNRVEQAVKMFKRPIEIAMPKCYIDFGLDEAKASYRPEHLITVSEGIVRDFPIDELAAILAHEVSHARECVRRRNYGDGRSHWEVDLEATLFVDKASIINCLKRLKSRHTSFFIRHPVICTIFPIPALFMSFGGYCETSWRIKKVSSAAAY